MTRIDARAAEALPQSLITATRAAPGDVAVVIAADVPPLERALLIAAIASLAIERAPARVNALDVTPGVAATEIDAALDFFAAADCTTGQVLRLSAEN